MQVDREMHADFRVRRCADDRRETRKGSPSICRQGDFPCWGKFGCGKYSLAGARTERGTFWLPWIRTIGI